MITLLKRLWAWLWRKKDEPTPTPTPQPTDEWGAALEAPIEDQRLHDTGETDWGSPSIRILSVRPDWHLGEWATKGLSQSTAADGIVTTTMVPIQGPSGKWYKPHSFRLKTDSATPVMGASVAAARSAYGSLTRARYECREKL